MKLLDILDLRKTSPNPGSTNTNLGDIFSDGGDTIILRRSSKAGFTIIETMLFLGITGLLVIGVLAGTSSSINVQRYRDSITSLQSFLQQQFSNVSNVSNDRNGNWSCDNNGTITAITPGTVRGQSDCVILGRFITTTNSGHTLSIRNVVGNLPSGLAAAQNDLAALMQYNIGIFSPTVNDNYDIEWDTSIVNQGTNVPASFSILMLRSPLSGVIRTFVNSTAVVNDSDIKTLLINQLALKQSVTMCVNPKGLFNGTRMAVFLRAGATSASGVETLGDNSQC